MVAAGAVVRVAPGRSSRTQDRPGVGIVVIPWVDQNSIGSSLRADLTRLSVRRG